MTAPAATPPSTAGHGLLPPSRSLLRRANEGCSFPPIPSTASLPPERRGRLRNGARPGDFLAAPRCGARTRTGCSCRQPAMANGRCRMHGGMSTGPRTAEGRERCRRARFTHGGYSAHVRTLRAAARAHGRRVHALLDLMRGRSAGHGVLRSFSGSRVGAAPCGRPFAPPQGRPRGGAPTCEPAIGVHLRSSAVSNPSSAGQGLHPSFSNASISPRASRLLAGTAPLAAFSAGHGVLRSFSSPAPVVPAGTP
jgi:hypothetical protein